MSQPSRRRLTALLVGAVVPAILLLGVALPTSIQHTEAGWTQTSAVSGQARAATIPAPRLTAPCEFRPGVLGLGARVRIFWSLPAGYTLADIEVRASTSGLGSVLAPLTGFNVTGNTVQQSDGTYRTDVPTNLLGGLLGLGSELEIALVVRDAPSGWVSTRAAVASNAGLLAGIGGTCRNLT
ncbi:hypothetical protein [Brachybacterium sp. GCM10030252]|uniref:hypothetical protein n=1 Tax=Brachybacterium sp. GCM10030252 TaxID=3273380 RepID=UPI00361FBDCB